MNEKNSTGTHTGTANDCLFCKLAGCKDNMVYETETLYVIVDRYPYSNRHLLIIPKSHHAVFHDCSASLITEMALTAKHLVDRLGMRSYNLLVNTENGQLIKHCHLHVIGANETGRLELSNVQTLNLNDADYKSLVDEIQTAIKKNPVASNP